MGISIYYTGVLRDKNLIEELTSEAAEIAAGHHWEYSELPHAPDIPIRGLIVQPTKCDPVWLTFHEDGNLCHPLLYSSMRENTEDNLLEATNHVMVTKTEYAGAETHMTLINFLRYLNEKYFSRFELTDDSKFWETGDDEYCRKYFGEDYRIKGLNELVVETYQTRPDNAKQIYKDIKAKLREESGIPKKKIQTAIYSFQKYFTMKTNITPQEFASLKEAFIAGITQVLNDQRMHEEEYSKLADIVNQSKHDIDDKDFTVKFEDMLHITRMSDELSIRKDEIEKRARKLFHSLTPSNIFVSQQFFDAWIEVSVNMFVRFDYMEDRLVVRELAEPASS